MDDLDKYVSERDRREPGFANKVDRIYTRMINEIKPGDLVRIKSGGPTMTAGMQVQAQGAADPNADIWHCMWVDGNSGLPQGVAIPEACLIKVYDVDQIAKGAYNAYGGAAGWKNYQDNPMPDWEDLPDNIQEYWAASAQYVMSESIE